MSCPPPDPSWPTVSVVITNFNGEHYLPGMMSALEATRFPFHEIIVSDDASRDGSRLLVRHRYPHARLLCNDVNRGPCPARNAGILAATGEMVLLLDNDGWPLPDAVEEMVRHMVAHPEVVAVMPRVVLMGDPPLVQCDGARTHMSGNMWLLHGHAPLAEAPQEAEPISSLMGTAMLFRRSAAVSIGGFEPSYFFYFEDHDFGTRMFLMAGPLASRPSAIIDHQGGTKGLSFRSGLAYPRRRAFLICRNRWLFLLRILQARTLLVLSPILLLHEVALLAFATWQGWLGIWFQAVTWHAGHLARTLRTRSDIQTRRRLPDRALLQAGPLPLHPGLMPPAGVAALMRGLLEHALGALFRLLAPLLGSHPRR